MTKGFHSQLLRKVYSVMMFLRTSFVLTISAFNLRSFNLDLHCWSLICFGYTSVSWTQCGTNILINNWNKWSREIPWKLNSIISSAQMEHSPILQSSKKSYTRHTSWKRRHSSGGDSSMNLSTIASISLPSSLKPLDFNILKEGLMRG